MCTLPSDFHRPSLNFPCYVLKILRCLLKMLFIRSFRFWRKKYESFIWRSKKRMQFSHGTKIFKYFFPKTLFKTINFVLSQINSNSISINPIKYLHNKTTKRETWVNFSFRCRQNDWSSIGPMGHTRWPPDGQPLQRGHRTLHALVELAGIQCWKHFR